jgi:hypothetical protein
MNFDEAMQTVPEPKYAYNREALSLLWDALFCAPIKGVVVEIGCEYGRSTMIILQVAKELTLDVYVVDPFIDWKGEEQPRIRAAFERTTAGREFTLLPVTSEEAFLHIPESIDFLHVDGDHTEQGIVTDCTLYLPRVRSGGIVAFHDYDYHDTPPVKKAVDAYTKGWPILGDAGTCHVVRKP